MSPQVALQPGTTGCRDRKGPLLTLGRRTVRQTYTLSVSRDQTEAHLTSDATLMLLTGQLIPTQRGGWCGLTHLPLTGPGGVSPPLWVSWLPAGPGWPWRGHWIPCHLSIPYWSLVGSVPTVKTEMQKAGMGRPAQRLTSRGPGKSYPQLRIKGWARGLALSCDGKVRRVSESGHPLLSLHILPASLAPA